MRKQITLLFACLFTGVILVGGVYTSAESNRRSELPVVPSQSSPADVVFSVPVDGDGIGYAATDAEEAEPWGPSSLRIGPDGNFFIVDSVNNRILKFDSRGNRLQTVTVSDAVAVTDVALNDSTIFALDEFALRPIVFQFSQGGELRGRQELPASVRSQGLSGITNSESGEVLLEFEGGTSIRRLSGADSLERALRGNRFSVNMLQRATELGGSRAEVRLPRGRVATVDVDNDVGGLNVISVDAAGNFYVLVEEVTTAPEIQVDQTIRRFRRDGTLTGVARVPINNYTNVSHNVAVSTNGEVYALVTKRDRVDVVRLQFASTIAAALPRATLRAISAAAATASIAAPLASPSPTSQCRTREQMVATAQSYVNNRVGLSLINLNGASDCATGRIKPHYLGSMPGEYDSVAYDWGGWDSVADYNRFMSEGRAAGDVDSHAVESCSHGVDCSGFVTVCWGRTDKKYGTRTLPEISDLIDGADLQRGDILNYAGKHVILFDRFARNARGVRGVMAWESTTTGRADRVIYRWSDWNRLAGYVARRYKRVC